MASRASLVSVIGFALILGAYPAIAGSEDARPVSRQDAVRPNLTNQWFAFGDDTGRMLTNIDTEGRSLLFFCEGGSGQVMLTHDALTPNDTSVTLVSGGQRLTYDIVAEGPGTEEGERRFMLAALGLDQPVIQTFRETGRIEVVAAGQSFPAVVTPDMKPTVEAFFTSCARR